MEHKWDDTDKG